MEELSKTHKDVPYGWVLVVGAIGRWIDKAMRGNRGLRDARDARLDVGLNNLASPH